MFNGVQDIIIDIKGRLAIPSKFKDVLNSFSSNKLCITLKSRKNLLLYPEQNWITVSNQLMNLPASKSSIVQSFQQLVLGNMEKLTPDNSGRILIPLRLRSLMEFANEKEVVMVGRADRLEIWGKNTWDKQIKDILDIDPKLLEKELSETNLRI